MDIITTHAHYDFDALASCVAAQKLFPTAKIVIPREGEELAHSFLKRYPNLFKNLTDFSEIQSISRLIIVDTSAYEKIDKRLRSQNIPVIVFDHHIDTENNITQAELYIKSCGATTTLLLSEIFKKKHISFSNEEALLFLLGIYEDTGKLSYPTTTRLDKTIAERLLNSYSIDMKTSDNFLTIKLHPEQKQILEELKNNESVFSFGSFKVAFSFVDRERDSWDYSSIVHVYRDQTDYTALFCLFHRKDKVHIIARSKDKKFPILAPIRYFGGGGHPTAAAATTHASEVHVILQTIKEIFFKKVILNRSCSSFKLLTLEKNSEIKIKPHVQTISIYITDEKKRLKEWRVNIPQKYITYPTHHIGNTTKMRTIASLIHKGFSVFLVNKKNIQHAFTHEDVARFFPEEFFSEDIPRSFTHAIPKAFNTLIETAIKVAEQNGSQLYLAGGPVRDLLMEGQELKDVDIVVAGEEAPSFALMFCEHLKNAEYKLFPQFKTAKVIAGKTELDIATARAETYTHPGALPIVKNGTLFDDLRRRDFTINAMALLFHRDAYRLVDLFGGKADIKRGIIRVLYNLSFIEDPTRMYRALRFAVRFDFRLDEHTEKLLKHTVSYDPLKLISSHRFKTEIKLFFSETEKLRVIEIIKQYGIHHHIHPDIRMNQKFMNKVVNAIFIVFLYIQETVYCDWLILVIALCDNLNLKQTQKVCERLNLTKNEAKILLASKNISDLMHKFEREKKPSQIYHLLRKIPIEVLIVLFAKVKTSAAKKHIMTYVIKSRHTKLDINGKTLKNLGMKTGPLFKKILEALHNAKLDGEIKTEDEEKEYLIKVIQNTKEFFTG